jgi:ribonuclease T2
MRTPQLTLPGLIALIVIALVLSYFERRGGETDTGGTRPVAPSTAPAETTGARGGNVAGDFDYYALVLSWSPTHCASPEGEDDDTQCARRDGRRYAFVVHGLWPQHERGYPESCPTRTRPYVPQSIIDGMLDVMPSKRLIIHEYRKHGTCSGLSPEAYFQTTRRMFQRLRIPERFRNPTEAQFLDPDDVVSDFVAANPALKPDMVVVACRGPGSRLREVRICFSKTGDLRSCGANERQDACRGTRMHVPPIR